MHRADSAHRVRDSECRVLCLEGIRRIEERIIRSRRVVERIQLVQIYRHLCILLFFKQVRLSLLLNGELRLEDLLSAQLVIVILEFLEQRHVVV